MTSIRFKHIYLFFILCFTFVSLLKSQSPDSLRKILLSTREMDKAEVYLQIGKILSEKYAQADSLLFYSQKGFEVAQKSGNQLTAAKSKLYIAQAYQLKNLYDTSSFILDGLQSSNFKEILGDIYFTLGLNHYRLNRNKEALENYLNAVREYENQKNVDGLALTYCRMSALFNNENQIDQAISYSVKSAELVDRIADPYMKLTTLSALSGVCIQIGVVKREYLDSSISYAKKSLNFIVKHGFYTKANQMYNTISNAYYLKHDSLMALEYCLQSLKFRKYLLPSEILISYLNLSDCYNRVQQHKNSLVYLDSVALILISVNDPYYQMSLYERIYAYNKDAGNLKAALAGLERFKSLQDSLYSLEKNSAINELEQKYNKSENEKKINELNRENEIASLNVKFLGVGILAALLILLVIVFFYRQSVLKNKFKALETEQRLNRARMNPHFFFNALASIQTLSMDAENQSKVSLLISKFSKIMRQSLESTYDELATIEDEILFISNYLDLQKTRFNNKFEYEIKVDENLAQDELKIPSMLLQPFLENSIEHGFKNIDYKGKLDVIFKKGENGINVELKDNGKGFDTTQKHKEYPSRATQIIADRLLILNKQHKSNSNYELTTNSDGKGICVRVNLPFIY